MGFALRHGKEKEIESVNRMSAKNMTVIFQKFQIYPIIPTQSPRQLAEFDTSDFIASNGANFHQ